MKKLRIYDHLGQLQKEFDVYVEGQDFTHTEPVPVPIWLGSIALEEASGEPSLPGPTKEEKVAEEPLSIKIVEDKQIEAQMEREAVVEKREKEEQIDKSEEIGDTSSGDTGTAPPEQLKSVEVIPEDKPGGKATKGSKRVRKSKTA